MEEKETEANKADKLQKFDVPKYIKVLSVIYIASSIATGFLSFAATFLEQGKITVVQTQYIRNSLRQCPDRLSLLGSWPGLL